MATGAEMERVVLVRHIEGLPEPADFRLERCPVPALAQGQFLIQNRYVSCDPGTRSRLSPGASYARPVMPGEPVDGFCLGHVIASRHPDFEEGALVTATGWASHVVSSGRGYVRRLPASDLPLSLWLGVLGIPGLTGWFAMHRVAGVRPGERVLITSAAGPVGATAGQVARAMGAAEVIGVAGGPVKCRWLTEQAGFSAALDHKAPDFAARLAEAGAAGFDVMLDNVGSRMIEAALPLMRTHGRIVLSGATADYSASSIPGVTALRELITRRLRMEGILVFDDMAQFPQAEAGLAAMVREGLAYREEIFDGLASLPEAFCGLFTGESFGRRLVRL